LYSCCEVYESTVISKINIFVSVKGADVDVIIIRFIKAKPSSIGSLITQIIIQASNLESFLR